MEKKRKENTITKLTLIKGDNLKQESHDDGGQVECIRDRFFHVTFIMNLKGDIQRMPEFTLLKQLIAICLILFQLRLQVKGKCRAARGKDSDTTGKSAAAKRLFGSLSTFHIFCKCAAE